MDVVLQISQVFGRCVGRLSADADRVDGKRSFRPMQRMATVIRTKAIGAAIRKSLGSGFGTAGKNLIQVALLTGDDSGEHGRLARAFSVFPIPMRFRDPVRYLLPLGGGCGLATSNPCLPSFSTMVI